MRSVLYSTFTLTWKNNQEEEKTATIKWGKVNNGQFEELEPGSALTMDTTASTISLLNNYEGMLYAGAVYTADGVFANGSSIETVLTKTENGWTCNVINTEDGTSTPTAIADGSTIYVLYTTEETPEPSGADDCRKEYGKSHRRSD